MNDVPPKDDGEHPSEPKRIPKNVSDVEITDARESDESTQPIDEFAAFRQLDAELRLRRFQGWELLQRILLRWIAVIIGISVICGMGLSVMHLFHHFAWGPFILVNSALSVAMIVTPVVSITTITVAIFVAAFRKFDEKDLDDLGNGVSNGIRLWDKFR